MRSGLPTSDSRVLFRQSEIAIPCRDGEPGRSLKSLSLSVAHRRGNPLHRPEAYGRTFPLDPQTDLRL